MHIRRSRFVGHGLAGAVGVALLTLAACRSEALSHRPYPQLAPSRALSSAPLPVGPSHTSTSPSVTTSSSTPTPPVTDTVLLPRGGRHIFPRFRVVAYYGVPGNPELGVLGAGTPEQIAAAVERQAAQYAGYGRPVLPAMELIATVAQAAPGPDGDYSAPIPAGSIRTYLRVAHEHQMLLILDIQPGSGEFLPQVEALRPFLLDPSVGIALDPEWKVPPGQAPGGGRIGSASAASVNAVGSYLAQLVQARGLPDKLLVIHEFTPTMLPDRAAIHPQPGVEITLHADGIGSPLLKEVVFRQLDFADTPFHIGFKLFLAHDTRVMSPREVMALRPRPDIVTYQ
jgi:hypothetical protein